MASVKLNNIPADVFKQVLDEQTRVKAQRGTKQYSFESTIYKMLRDYDKCRKSSNFKPEE